MKTKRMIAIAAWFFLTACLAQADTFKHLTSGETFDGFRTHKKSAGKTLVYNAELNKFVPVELADYQVEPNDKGRRDTVMIIKLDQPEILVSDTIAAAVSDAILKAADQGPKALIVQIDLPGGQGSPMRTVAEAVAQAADSAGCRVAAYLPGGTYGGAFSAAALVALASQRIYIAPTASMGAVGPLVGTTTNEEYTRFLETYSPDALSTFSIYAVTLAQRRNRPELLARALVDKQLAIAEVRSTDGKQALVEVSQRQDNQSVVRMITEGLPAGSSADSSAPSLQAYSKLLSLPSAEAIRWKMADKQASTLQEVLEDMALTGTPTVNVAGFSTTIPKFAAARRNLDQLLTKIQWEEDRVATLEQHLAEMEKIALTSTVTREVNRGGQYESYRRGSIRLRTQDTQPTRYYNERDYTDESIPLTDRYGRDIRSRDREGYTDRERIIDEQPSGNIPEVRMQIMAVLTEMVADYQRAINLAKRWPGALPAGISLETLQRNMNSAQTLYNGIQRRAMQGY